MNGWERVKFVMENEGHNKNSFSKAIGMASNVTITRIINEKRRPQRATYQKIAQKFPQYSLEWLFTGIGNMYNQPEDVKETKRITKKIEKVSMLSDLVSVNEKKTNDLECCDTGCLEKVAVIADREYHGKYRLFEVKGDSMDNDTRRSICDADIVLAREVQRDLWAHNLNIKDWYFVIVHRTDGISVKQITRHDAERGTITCHSLNDMFSDYTIQLDDVAELYHLVKIVDRSARL